MKVTISFDLDNYELNDRQNLEMAMDAQNFYYALWEFAHNSRKGIEWSMEGQSEIDRYEVIHLVYEKFFQILESNHIDLSKYS